MKVCVAAFVINGNFVEQLDFWIIYRWNANAFESACIRVAGTDCRVTVMVYKISEKSSAILVPQEMFPVGYEG